MLSINIGKLRLAQEKLTALKRRVSDTADGRFRQKLYYILELGATVAPQFSGDFVSNFHLVVDGNMPSYHMWPEKQGLDSHGKLTPMGQAHQAGDSAAIDFATRRAAGVLRGVTRKSNVHLVNMTDLTTDGTHMIGPDGTVKLRPVNLIPGNVRIESYIRARVKEM